MSARAFRAFVWLTDQLLADPTPGIVDRVKTEMFLEAVSAHGGRSGFLTSSRELTAEEIAALGWSARPGIRAFVLNGSAE